jgi:ABC-type nitrate/sulfonate/bicarbonate transport system permease component
MTDRVARVTDVSDMTDAQKPAIVDKATPVMYRGGGFQPVERAVVSWVAVVGIILLWQLGDYVGWINPTFLPSPWSIVLALQDLIVTGELWEHLKASLMRIGLGWIWGAGIGLIVGVGMGLFSISRSIGMPLVSGLFPIPKIALLPLLILWFGIGESSKVITIALGVFFPTVIAVFSGIDSIPRNLIRMAQSFNLPYFDIVRKVILPGAWPAILSGFRISVSTALLLVVSAEMIGAEKGIGAFVLTTGNLMQIDRLMAGVVTISILGLIIGAVLSHLESRLRKWR